MKFVKYLLILAVCCILLGAGSIIGLYKYVEPQLPDVATLRDVRLQIPMQVYSADGELMAQYGEKRRIPLTLNQIPPVMVKAFIATEDSRFYEHHGVDPVGIFRAASVALFSGHASQGASTITQQLARNFFLSPEKTLIRKIKEVFLAIRIEQLLSKDEILELYLNKIYLGYRAYGVGAAAQVYFGKSIDQLTLSEMATIAGLPKAPSTFNPLYSLDRATARRNVVLSRMLSEGYISQDEYDRARSDVIDANYHAPEIAFSSPYLTEMVRQEMVRRYGDKAYEDGYRVYTTVTRKVQQAAQQAVRNNVMDYDMRHGYRGPSNVLWRVGEGAWADYRFVLGEKGEVLNIVAEPRRIANRIVEEAMISANICAARVLRDKLGFGIYNVHTGFDPANTEALAALLKTHDVHVDPEEVLTLPGFCKLRRELDAQPSGFLDSRIRRFQSFAEISTEPGPHFGLGLEAYATWTSPIRKYGDMVNHRLLKAIIKGESVARPQDETTLQMAERRRLNRMAERDVGDWLYARFLNDKAGTDTRFPAEIIDISRGGMRVRLVDNGAVAFIPAPFLHAVRDELVCSQENGTVQIKGETVYKVTDVIDVNIAEVRMETRSIIARPVA